MTMLADAFLQSRRLKAAGRKKESVDRLATDPAGDQAGDPRSASKTATYAVPALP